MSFMLRKSQERPAQRPTPRVAPASIIAVASGKGGDIAQALVEIPRHQAQRMKELEA